MNSCQKAGHFAIQLASSDISSSSFSAPNNIVKSLEPLMCLTWGPIIAQSTAVYTCEDDVPNRFGNHNRCYVVGCRTINISIVPVCGCSCPTIHPRPSQSLSRLVHAAAISSMKRQQSRVVKPWEHADFQRLLQQRKRDSTEAETFQADPQNPAILFSRMCSRRVPVLKVGVQGSNG